MKKNTVEEDVKELEAIASSGAWDDKHGNLMLEKYNKALRQRGITAFDLSSARGIKKLARALVKLGLPKESFYFEGDEQECYLRMPKKSRKGAKR